MTTVDRVRGLSASVAIKAPVRAATTANISNMNGLMTIDGVSLAAGDRVLVKDQSTASQNGIYLVDTGDWSRDSDFDGSGDVVLGTLVFVTGGTINGETFWRQSTSSPVIGTSSITFAFVGSGPPNDLGIATATRIMINPSSASPADPVGYHTPLLVVSNNNEDNVVTLRAQDSNVNGHTAIRLQDYEGYERGAVGLGGDYNGNPFRYTVFMEGGNIAANYGTKDTSIMLGITHSGNPNISNGFIPRILVVPSEYDGATDSGGWTRIGAEDRGVAKNAIIIDRTGKVGIGLSITQSAYPNNNTGSDPTVRATLHVNGAAYFDQDHVTGGSMSNSTDLVVVRSQATGKASVRVGVKDVGSIDIGVASTTGAIGVDGSLPLVIRTGITGGDLTTGTERMRADASGNVVINTAAIATNASNGFLYVPTCAGTPTGTPTTYTGRAPIVVDTTNHKLYFYDGTWRDAGP